jgi:Uma2 family endonuclease
VSGSLTDVKRGQYEIDPADPRAPSLEVWEQLSPEERQRIVETLPSEIELEPPEGDPHRIPKQRALEALDAYFRQIGRRVYLSSELPVYYPAERMFAPDVIAVLDAEPHERKSWVVTAEGKGIDLALEVVFEGSRKKDLEDNVTRFASLGISEYFVFDRLNRRLHGWRLTDEGDSYAPVIPQAGRWHSGVLNLDLAVEGDRFRFFSGTAVVPETLELLARANSLVDGLQNRLEEAERHAEAAERHAEAAERRAEEERLRAEAAELRVRELENQLERLLRNEP